MRSNHYHKVIQSALFAYAHHRIILDEEGKPCDYIFLEVNPESFGYTIIHGLVRQLQGQISFHSPGKGLRVEIRFPRGKGPSGQNTE